MVSNTPSIMVPVFSGQVVLASPHEIRYILILSIVLLQREEGIEVAIQLIVTAFST